MQTISFKNHNPVMGLQLNSENQFCGLRRARMKSRAILLPFRNGSRLYLDVHRTTSRSWWMSNGENKTVAE